MLTHNEKSMEYEQNWEREQLAAEMVYGAAIGKVTSARLMSPEELITVVRDRSDLRGKVDGWCLCTELPAAMWEQAHGAGGMVLPHHLTVAEMQSSGRHYLAVVLQAKEWQHRICVPLVGNETARWLKALEGGAALQLSVANGTSEMAAVFRSDVSAGAIEQFRKANTTVPDDWRVLLAEAMKFMAWNDSVALVDRPPGQPVPSEVSLSLLFPAEVQAELERMADTSRGRKHH